MRALPTAAGSGGGSVTIPLKEALLPHMDSLSEAARAIGSLNTITRQADGTLAADNTDWIGVREWGEGGWGRPRTLLLAADSLVHPGVGSP